MLKSIALSGGLLRKFESSTGFAPQHSLPTLFLRDISTQLDSPTKSLPVYNLDFEQVHS
jgi:hypothetical protein